MGRTASGLLIEPLAEYFADRHDPVRFVFVALVLSVFSLAIIPFASGIVLLGTVAIGGIGVGSVWTKTDTIVSILAKEGWLAATLGAAGSFKELGDMLGPLRIGVLSQLWGLRIGFLSCALLGLGGTFVIGISRRPQIAKDTK